jgi:hypothetical protein
MKNYAQFCHMSTGYIEGTTPPQFSEAHKKPIDACGSDSVMSLDGRLSLFSMHKQARELAKQRGFIGYRLCRGLTCNGPLWQTAIFPV